MPDERSFGERMTNVHPPKTPTKQELADLMDNPTYQWFRYMMFNGIEGSTMGIPDMLNLLINPAIPSDQREFARGQLCVLDDWTQPAMETLLFDYLEDKNKENPE